MDYNALSQFINGGNQQEIPMRPDPNASKEAALEEIFKGIDPSVIMDKKQEKKMKKLAKEKAKLMEEEQDLVDFEAISNMIQGHNMPNQIPSAAEFLAAQGSAEQGGMQEAAQAPVAPPPPQRMSGGPEDMAAVQALLSGANQPAPVSSEAQGQQAKDLGAMKSAALMKEYMSNPDEMTGQNMSMPPQQPQAPAGPGISARWPSIQETQTKVLNLGEYPPPRVAETRTPVGNLPPVDMGGLFDPSSYGLGAEQREIPLRPETGIGSTGYGYSQGIEIPDQDTRTDPLAYLDEGKAKALAEQKKKGSKTSSKPSPYGMRNIGPAGRKGIEAALKIEADGLERIKKRLEETRKMQTGINFAPLAAWIDSIDPDVKSNLTYAAINSKGLTPQQKAKMINTLEGQLQGAKSKSALQRIKAEVEKGKRTKPASSASGFDKVMLQHGLRLKASEINRDATQVNRFKVKGYDSAKKLGTKLTDGYTKLANIKAALRPGKDGSISSTRVNQSMSQFARFIAGENGVLTEKDIDRVNQPNLWKTYNNLKAYFADNATAPLTPELVSELQNALDDAEFSMRKVFDAEVKMDSESLSKQIGQEETSKIYDPLRTLGDDLIPRKAASKKGSKPKLSDEDFMKEMMK